MTCTRCGLAYHRECWRENEGCATYGCRGGATVNPPGPRATGGPLDLELGPEPAWERPLPSAPFDLPLGRPLLGVLCEALALIGGVFGAVLGGVEGGAKGGTVGLLIGVVVGLLLGTVAGAVAVPVGVLALGAWAADWTLARWGLVGVAAPVVLCVILFAILLRIRVHTWPPILR